MPTIDMQKVDELRDQLQSQKNQNRIALLRAISGSMRMKILLLLDTHREGLSVVDLSHILHASLSRISHQMRILLDHQIIVPVKKDGKTIYQLRFTDLMKWLMG